MTSPALGADAAAVQCLVMSFVAALTAPLPVTVSVGAAARLCEVVPASPRRPRVVQLALLVGASATAAVVVAAHL